MRHPQGVLDMASYAIRHAVNDEVLTQDGFTPRARRTHEGMVFDDSRGIEFTTVDDAKAWLALIGQQHEPHRILPYDGDTTQNGGTIGKATIDAADFFGV
jgi:hypothetical protein